MAKILTAYFSMKGQTIGPGMKIVHQEKGNTAVVAEFIQKAVGGDLFEIEPGKTYSEDHMALIREAQEEQRAGTRVPVKALPQRWESYDTIFVGFPNWWNRLPMPVVTFLESLDWTGKKVVPFITSEGSGWGNTLSEMRELCGGAAFGEGLSLQGSKAASSESKINAWATQQI